MFEKPDQDCGCSGLVEDTSSQAVACFDNAECRTGWNYNINQFKTGHYSNHSSQLHDTPMTTDNNENKMIDNMSACWESKMCWGGIGSKGVQVFVGMHCCTSNHHPQALLRRCRMMHLLIAAPSKLKTAPETLPVYPACGTRLLSAGSGLGELL